MHQSKYSPHPPPRDIGGDWFELSIIESHISNITSVLIGWEGGVCNVEYPNYTGSPSELARESRNWDNIYAMKCPICDSKKIQHPTREFHAKFTWKTISHSPKTARAISFFCVKFSVEFPRRVLDLHIELWAKNWSISAFLKRAMGEQSFWFFSVNVWR